MDFFFLILAHTRVFHLNEYNITYIFLYLDNSRRAGLPVAALCNSRYKAATLPTNDDSSVCYYNNKQKNDKYSSIFTGFTSVILLPLL